MVKRGGEMAARYQAHIDRQAKIITRLQNAAMAYGDGLTEVVNAKNVREARSVADKALKMGAAILAVPNDNKENER
jgi:hypothetical protein